MTLDDLTIKQAKELAAMFGQSAPTTTMQNPFLGRYVVCRTYSAGVHVGVLEYANGKEVRLSDAIRIWKWTGGGLSLSAIASQGQKGGRNDRTGDIWLTEVIEIIPATEEAWKSYARFIEA